MSSSLTAEEAKGVIRRHRPTLAEMVYLLEHKNSNDTSMLRQKLAYSLTTQLDALVEERLSRDFEALHDALEARKASMVSEVTAWERDFQPELVEHCRRIEDTEAADRLLVDQASLMLSRDVNAVTAEELEALIGELDASLQEDSLQGIAQLRARINLNEYRAMGLDGLNRAIQRVYIARGASDSAASALDGVDQVFDPACGVVLDPNEMDWNGVYDISRKNAEGKWTRLFEDQSEIGTDDDLKKLVLELLLQLTQDYRVPNQYITTLFSSYRTAPQRIRKQLQAEVLDAMHDLFEGFSSNARGIWRNIRNRIDYAQTGFIEHELFVTNWAIFLEKSIQVAVRTVIERLNTHVVEPVLPSEDDVDGPSDPSKSTLLLRLQNATGGAV